MLKRNLILINLFLLFISPLAVKSQFYNGSLQQFGKNKIQYREFFWTSIKYNKFETYFYQDGKALALYTAKTATKVISEVEKTFDYTLNKRIQFIIFNKYEDFKQSNIGFTSEESYNTGGLTYISENKVLLYFEGDRKKFEEQIRAGVASVIIKEIIHGGSIGSMVKNSTIMSIPDWYLNGLISYISYDWNENIDNRVRDGILSGRYLKFNNLTGEDATIAGHAIWKYIADRYGKNVISNIIYMTKVSKGIDNGFLFVLGTSLKNLSKDWVEYYDSHYYFQEKEREIQKKENLFKKGKKDFIYTQFKISPDGKYAVYVTNDLGKYKIKLYNFEKKRTKTILRSGYKLDFKVDISYPTLAWHPTSEFFSTILERKGKLVMMYYNVSEKHKEYIRLMNIEKVLNFSYSQEGKMFVLSGVENGQSNIYVYSNLAHTFEPITKDGFDDLYPHFAKNSKEIIFSSNRTSDTIRFDERNNNPQSTLDLFIYNYEKRSPILKRLTNTPNVNEIYPMEYDKNYYTFLSDSNGIINKYVAHLDSSISFVDTTTHYRYNVTSFPISNNTRNILEYDENPLNGKSSEIVYSSGRYNMYINPIVKSDSIKPKKLLNTYYKEEIFKTAEIAKMPETPLSHKVERTVEKAKKKKKKITNVSKDANLIANDTSKIDINNYQFVNENQVQDNQQNLDADTATKVKVKKDSVVAFIPKQRNYDVSYSVYQVLSQLGFSNLNNSYQSFNGNGIKVPGFDALIGAKLYDLMEDYRISGGFKVPLDLKTGEYLLSYENLKHRFDEQYILHRQTYQTNYSDATLQNYLSEGFYILKYPFSEITCLRGTINVANIRSVYKAYAFPSPLDTLNLKQPNENVNLASITAEYVYDNTKLKAINIYNGTRFKIFAQYQRQINKDNTNMYTFGFDFRHYTKIFKTFIWANRIAGCSSLGQQKIDFFLGGVDNWWSSKFDNSIAINPNQNYAFMAQATNLRGFDVNIRNGSNFALLNSELRFPVFKCLIKRPIKSEFISNFQIVGFGDVGTAWVGTNPFSDENTLFNETISKYPFTITLENKEDPLVGGFGFGFRSKLLGYFVRTDWAWGVRDRIIQPHIFYLSLSLDF